ncbi:MAG: YybH family protein [Planctomycetota bacterium]
MRQRFLVTALFLSLALGCAPAAGDPVQDIDLEAARASLMEADRAWVADHLASDSPLDVLDGHLTDDVRVLAPDAPIAQGRQEALALFGALYDLPGFSLSWSPSMAEVGGGGDLGYTIGAYHMAFEDPEGGPVRSDGKYMTVWKKQSDDTWKVAVDMFNAD